jgi:replicative DNA helicase
MSQGLPSMGPPVVCVDFLQQVSIPHLQDNIYNRMNEVTERLYELAKARGIAMIWMSQLRKADRIARQKARTIEDELAMMSIDEFEGSPRIGNLAHTALFLMKPKDGFTSNGHAKVYAHMPKVRAGSVKTLEGLFTGNTLEFDFDSLSIHAKL